MIIQKVMNNAHSGEYHMQMDNKKTYGRSRFSKDNFKDDEWLTRSPFRGDWKIFQSTTIIVQRGINN